MINMQLWAIRMRYLSSTDNKWHSHTTRWYPSSGDAWEEAELFQRKYKDILECASSLVHKEKKPSRQTVHHKKVYYRMPNDLPPGRYECVLRVKETSKKLIVYLQDPKVGLYKDQLEDKEDE